jgi:hypothetical protein
MPEIIPYQRLKIIPWPQTERLIVFKRTKEKIVFMGLNRYFERIGRRKYKLPVDNPNKGRKLPYNEVSGSTPNSRIMR